jgi:hypothetical protein
MPFMLIYAPIESVNRMTIAPHVQREASNYAESLFVLFSQCFSAVIIAPHVP